jgi:Holliday junction resolvase RusA-like endonuclease
MSIITLPSKVFPDSHYTSMRSEPFLVARLELPPGINQSYKIVKNRKTGHHYLAHTPEGEQFLHDAALLLTQARCNDVLIEAIRNSKEHVPLSVELKFFFMTWWRRDVDGGIKIALDAVFRYLRLDDRLVTDLPVKKLVDAQYPRLEVSVAVDLAACAKLGIE